MALCLVEQVLYPVASARCLAESAPCRAVRTAILEGWMRYRAEKARVATPPAALWEMLALQSATLWQAAELLGPSHLPDQAVR